MIWSQWFTSGCPKIGDYVDIKCILSDDSSGRTEGFVVKVTDSIIALAPDTPWDYNPEAVAWRIGTLSEEKKAVVRELELVDATI